MSRPSPQRGARNALLCLACALVSGAAATEGPPPGLEGAVPREPCASRDPLRRAFFGDLHVHTALSLDAATMDTRNRPADAYRFARGETIGLQPYRADGSPMRTLRLARPLDFAAVTDHAELIGEVNICGSEGLPGHDSFICRVYRRWPRVAFFWMNFQANRAVRHDFCGEGGALCREAALAPWQEIRDAAEAFYDRSAACRFTTFTGYEWTGGRGAGNNFHRNVIFANEIVPELPTSFVEASELPELWRRLGTECADAGTGCDVLVIPHNSNLGGGRMFQTQLADGRPIDAAHARERQRYEPLVEIMQHKGESECMQGIDTEDELCNFENLPFQSFRAQYASFLQEPPLPRQFVRHILKEGLAFEEKLGVNPFRFGITASSDTHMAIPGAVDETASYPGHGGAGKPPGDELEPGFPDHLYFNPGGLAVLWAEENSRASLFAALKRRESYGTSGPRIVLRFFGAESLPAGLCDAADLAEKGYASGVPMGGTLRGAQGAHFVVSALGDPGAAGEPSLPLQRIQIVKGWLDGEALRERVVDVAGDATSGAGVDTATCEPTGPADAGSTELCAVWRDPDFDPKQRAFYYARVLENPSCRWSQRLCVSAGIDCAGAVPDAYEPCCDAAHQPVIQERAWTSPIWFRPEEEQPAPAPASGEGGTS